jgi:1-acyl-sn-glycerol-3-phosphate acyltransferase
LLGLDVTGGLQSGSQRETNMASNDPPKHSRTREPEDLRAHIDKALALSDEADASLVYRIMQFYFDPQFLHVERLHRERPSLFVANHASWGWEGGFLPSAIREHTGKLPRLLTDSEVILGPLEDPLMKLGMVLANRKVCAALMDAGESILVFPGGAREGAKRRGEQYKLFWEGRDGFVRMAIQHGFTITPVATVGPDEMWDIRWDHDDLAGTWVESTLRGLAGERFVADLIPPIPSGMFGTLLPRPERAYVAFGEPVDTRRFAGRKGSAAVVNKIKDAVQSQLESLIKETLLERARRRHEMHWLRRWLTRY